MTPPKPGDNQSSFSLTFWQEIKSELPAISLNAVHVPAFRQYLIGEVTFPGNYAPAQFLALGGKGTLICFNWLRLLPFFF